MPTYKYKCHVCENVWEERHLFSEKPEPCECSSEDIERVPSFVRIESKIEKRQLVGDVVKEFLKEATEDLGQQQQDYQSKEYGEE